MTVVQLRPDVISGSLSFSNRDLSLPFAMPGEPLAWVVRGQLARIDGRGSIDIHPRFAAEDGYGAQGSMFENEHGLTAEFLFSGAHFDLLQAAALSGADLVVTVGFAARNDIIETLMLSIEHKTA